MPHPLRLESEILELHTRHPFIIARGGQSDYRTVMVRLIDGDGIEGWGEAAPNRIYGESVETVHGALQNYSNRLPSDPFLLEDAESGWESILALNPSARVALSSALHDLVGKRLGIPVYKLWGLDPAKAPRSTFTIGIDNDAKLRQKVKEAEQYPILKIKLGTDRDVEILETIRGMTQKELRVDANCGWSVKQAIRMLPVLEEFGVTVLEQPLAAEDHRVPPVRARAAGRAAPRGRAGAEPEPVDPAGSAGEARRGRPLVRSRGRARPPPRGARGAELEREAGAGDVRADAPRAGARGAVGYVAVLASSNENKLRELRHALEGWTIELLGADDYPPETGETYYENARAKAVFARTRIRDRWTLGEDSGIGTWSGMP